MPLAHERRNRFRDKIYLQNCPDACPWQANVDWVNVGDDVSHCFEFIKKLHELVCLIREKYPAVFIVPAYPLHSALLLQFASITQHIG
jgi:hypothetical protein